MSSPASRPATLGDLVDLAVQLQRDAGHAEAELHRRDRALAGQLAGERRSARARLLAWLDALRPHEQPLPGRQFTTAFRLLLVGLLVLGLLFGWGAALAMFHYDGSRPVNVVNVLAVFVGAQLLLLALLGIVMLPGRLVRWLPGTAAIQDALGWLSPGQLVRLAEQWLPTPARDALRRSLPGHPASILPFHLVQKWVIIFSAQTFAVTFNVGALAASLYLVTFSDLAFAWSTTLPPDADTVHRLTQSLAVPWASWATHAVPSPELIRDTLYYRQAGIPGGADPIRWGQWWPFLVACMVTYGLLPRVALLAWSGWRFRRSVNRALVEAPGAAVVLDRLTSEWVSTQAAQPETATAAGVARSAFPPAEGPGLEAVPLCLINWGGLERPDATLQQAAQAQWRREIAGVHHAGGRATLEEDAQTIATIAATAGQPGVALLVKAWEPPVLEVVDFLRDLRQALGQRRLILVAPVDLNDHGQLRPPPDAATEQWRKRLRSLGDAALVVRPWTEGGAA